MNRKTSLTKEQAKTIMRNTEEWEKANNYKRTMEEQQASRLISIRTYSGVLLNSAFGFFAYQMISRRFPRVLAGFAVAGGVLAMSTVTQSYSSLQTVNVFINLSPSPLVQHLRTTTVNIASGTYQAERAADLLNPTASKKSSLNQDTLQQENTITEETRAIHEKYRNRRHRRLSENSNLTEEAVDSRNDILKTHQ
eukprot:TRINITY_DN23239_c0_g1_i1.p1 TRINITY_DN23239_c0_g1~~TRINITY_DN23239_c0_g1_i1.p1  ORF type:complete len:208 (-),score=52.06 TRINITY_DN23239_c0_g1_i1:298-882(-)